MDTQTLCRACANACDRWYAINSKIWNFSTTLKDMIVLLVPQMQTELSDNDVICNICQQTLSHCVKFIDKCLRVEADRKDNFICLKSPSDVPPITILEDGVIKKEEDDISDVDQKSTNSSGLNGDFKNDEETDIKIENNHGIVDNTLQNQPVEEFFSSTLNHNRFISAKQISADKLNEFIHILGSNDVKTIEFSQNSGRPTEKKRVIFIGSTFKCSKCYKYFDSRIKYSRHLRVHKRVEQRREERQRLRKLKIQKLEELKAQKKKQRTKTRVDLECGTCSEKFSSTQDLELHLKIHPPFVCEKCGKGFAKKSQMNGHKAVHNKENSYICEVCGKGCKTKTNLRNHGLIHEDTVLSCKKCPKVFSGVIRLRAHLKNTHGEGRTRIWTCKECGKIFSRACLYQTHYRQIHLRDGHKKCDICGQGFYRTDYLVRHRRHHLVYGETRESLYNDAAKFQTDERANGTENGDKRRFIRLPPGRLASKRRIGTLPPGPYQCQLCKKLYKKVEHLKRHILSHGKSRFSCKSCSRTFKVKYQLTRHEKLRHQKSDLSVKYRCEICWKRFEIQEDLDQHYSTHGNLKHKCELCEESFARQHLLTDHIGKFHVDDDDAEEELRKLMEAGLEKTLYNLINI